MPWLYLLAAGLMEVAWATGLKYTEGFTKIGPSVATIAAMAASFLLLSRALNHLPLSTAYVVWTGIGAIGTVVVGVVVFGESSDTAKLLFVSLIVVGIVGLRFTGAA